MRLGLNRRWTSATRPELAQTNATRPESARNSPNECKSWNEKKKKKNANRFAECESTCRRVSGVGATALEPHSCFLGCTFASLEHTPFLSIWLCWSSFLVLLFSPSLHQSSHLELFNVENISKALKQIRKHVRVRERDRKKRIWKKSNAQINQLTHSNPCLRWASEWGMEGERCFLGEILFFF